MNDQEPDPTEKAALEIEKLRLELAKLRAETMQLQASLPNSVEKALQRELLQTQVDTEKRKLTPRARDEAKDWLTIAATAVPLITVAIALITLVNGISKYADERLRTQRATISELGEGLSHANPTTRIAKANALAPFINDELFRDEVASVLLAAALQEEERTVRGTLVQVLSLSPAAAYRQWMEMRPVAWSNLEEFENEFEALTIEIARADRIRSTTSDADQKRQAETNIQQLMNEADRLDERIENLQQGVVALVVSTRGEIPVVDCAKQSGCPHCRADLSGFFLRDFDFFATGLSFCNADLSDANLISANFTGLDLTSTDFSGSDLREAHFRRSILKDTDFSDADLSWQRASGGRGFPLTDFSEADLTDAVFDRTCLSGADFRRAAVPPTASQMSSAFAAGAKFRPALEQQLKSVGAIHGGPRCLTP